MFYKMWLDKISLLTVMTTGLQRLRWLMPKFLGISNAVVTVTSNIFFQQSTQHDFILKQGNVLKQYCGIVGKLQKNVSV